MTDEIIVRLENDVDKLREIQNSLFKVCEENNLRSEGDRLKDIYLNKIHSAVVRIQEAIDLLK